ncbi:hypothetical protein DFS34DRAFT_196972 [Phlyctochytrium arcticum]|nr:hypothetical protein DFS34DRAFT_196972 [Phlyctochytrium arcticum]
MILKPTTLSYSPNPSPVQTQEDGTEVYVGHRVREIIISKKKLPEIGTHARYWGFVDHVVDDVGELEGYLKGSTYETKTRGTRHLEAARPVGEGVYAIVEHGSHTHLAYVLSLPETPTEVQKAFNIQSEGSYILSIKNPTVSSAPGTGLHGPQKAQLPPAFQSLFKQLRFIPANPPALLDFQHTEILLIGASDDVGNELGREGQELEQMEEEAHKEIVKLEDEHLFDELRLDKMEFKTEPLFGEWA